MIKISIIMPLYNAEKYLEECLISIKKQTFEDYELICINDASEDSTLSILKKFQRDDNRIRIYSNSKRRGAAFSRNRGIGLASGEYLSILDGDDIFDEMMLEKAYHTAKSRDVDIVMFEAKYVPSESIYIKSKILHSREFTDRYCTEAFSIKDCEPYEMFPWLDSPLNKLYRKDFIDRNHIAFQDLPCSNDVCFVMLGVMTAERVIFMDVEDIMVYIRNHSVSTRISYDRDPMCAYYAMVELLKQLIERNQFEKLYEHYYFRLFETLIATIVNIRKEEKREVFYRFLQNEGIDRIRLMGGQAYNRINNHLRSLIEQFEKKEYETQWYFKTFRFDIHLYYHADKILEMFRRFDKEGSSVGVWGAGNNGEFFLEFCRHHNLNLTAVMDKSEEKQGSVIGSYQVMAPDKCMDRVQIIFVTPYFIYEDVKKEIGEREIEVIDLIKVLDFT